MNYTNPALINALSAQYVLGTLRGKARMRFESLKFSNSSIQEAVNHWESQLHPLSFELQPVHPQDHVWQNILLRISGHKAIQSSQQAPPAASNITPITRAQSDQMEVVNGFSNGGLFGARNFTSTLQNSTNGRTAKCGGYD